MTEPPATDQFTHATFKVSDLGHGLRPFDNCLGFLTSYTVKSEDGLLCVFAFAVNGFDLKVHMDEFVPEEFLARARETIRLHIDTGAVDHRGEYTFEYDLWSDIPVFREVDDPRWWIKW